MLILHEKGQFSFSDDNSLTFWYPAKPGKVVGPVSPFENGNVIKEAYDNRAFVRNTIHAPHVNPPAYCYRGNGSVKQEKSTTEVERISSQTRQLPQCGIAPKLAPDIAIDIDNNPYYVTRAAVGNNHVDDRITIDTNLLQVKSQYSGIGVAAAAASATSRNVGTVQFGVSRMY